MLGRDHALTGAAAFAALAPAFHVTSPAALTAGVLLTAGAATLPDIDHPDSTISRQFGFLTRGFAWCVEKISGGHRHGTHSLAGIAVFTAVALSLGARTTRQAATCAPAHTLTCLATLGWYDLQVFLFIGLLISAALRAVRIGGHHGDLLGLAAAAAIVWTWGALPAVTLGSWHVPLLAAATGLGCASHIAGDELTHGGCPLLWPVSKHEFHLLPGPLRFTTARLAETWVVFPVLAIALAAALARDAGVAGALARLGR